MQDQFKYCMCSQIAQKAWNHWCLRKKTMKNQDQFQFLFIDDARKIFGIFVHRWREEFGVRDIKEEDIDEQDKKVKIYIFI